MILERTASYRMYVRKIMSNETAMILTNINHERIARQEVFKVLEQLTNEL